LPARAKGEASGVASKIFMDSLPCQKLSQAEAKLLAARFYRYILNGYYNNL